MSWWLRTRNGRAKQADLPFPRDIMMEILHRLPLKSLLTCKRVSKQWKELINDPIFYKRHSNGRPAFILGPETDILSGLFISKEGLELHRVPIGLKKLATYSCRPGLLNSGSSNGMVCVNSPNGIFLLHNLFTGGSFAVTNAPMRQNSWESWICYGFGYDSHADDYKMLVVCDYHPEVRRRRAFDWSRVQNAEKSLFWVYSFNNKGWEQFQGFPAASAACNIFRSQAAAHSLNGVLHWVVERRRGGNKDSKREEVIVTYDLHTSSFGEMLLPYDSGEIHGHGNVSELNGCLWYCYTMDCGFGGNYRQTFKYVVWVMNHYGFHDSWEKVATIDCSLVTQIPLRSPGQIHVWESVAPAALYKSSKEGSLYVLFACHSSGKMFADR